MDQILLSFLEQRWQRLINTNFQYINDLTSPANQACIRIAQILGKLKHTPYLLLLMPGLARVPASDYISSSYDEEHINLSEMILDDANERLINIPDVLSASSKDGILKFNSLFNKIPKKLSRSEQNRFLSRHPLIKKAYEAQQRLLKFKYHRPSVAASVNRFINGLHEGGNFNQGTEYIAGSKANTAIVVFSEYLQTLDPETLDLLFTAKRTEFDIHTETYISNSFKDYWLKLSAPLLENVDLPEYCIQSIANFLEEIVDINSYLYNLPPSADNQNNDFTQDIEELEIDKSETYEDMLNCFDSIEYQDCYVDMDHFISGLLSILSKDREFVITFYELQLIVTTYQEALKTNNKEIIKPSEKFFQFIDPDSPIINQLNSKQKKIFKEAIQKNNATSKTSFPLLNRYSVNERKRQREDTEDDDKYRRNNLSSFPK